MKQPPKLIVIMTIIDGKMVQGNTKTYSTWKGALKNFLPHHDLIEETENCRVLRVKDVTARVYFLVDVFNEASQAALETKFATVQTVVSG